MILRQGFRLCTEGRKVAHSHQHAGMGASSVSVREMRNGTAPLRMVPGRLMSRHAAFQALSMEEFQKEMEGIYTTCVVPDTLDESPMAYKSMDEIIDQIEPTVEIVQRIRPVYNFKASD